MKEKIKEFRNGLTEAIHSPGLDSLAEKIEIVLRDSKCTQEECMATMLMLTAVNCRNGNMQFVAFRLYIESFLLFCEKKWETLNE